MKVLVCGGRDYFDEAAVFRKLDAIHAETPISCVMQGGARGADALGDKWARQNKIPNERYAASWNDYGRAAGPIRNKEMLEKLPALVVAFPGGVGTKDMVRQAAKAGIEVTTL
jgi:YspA, cpYpsA-related SLOG family